MDVLWLVSWFPNRTNPLDGDFIERHARAASLKSRTYVIFVVKAPFTPAGKTEAILQQHSASFYTAVYYYPGFTHWGKLVEKIHSNWQYMRLHWKAYRYYKKQFGKPTGILVQVGLKAGLMAMVWKVLDRVPYVLFERWGGILPKASPNFNDLSFAKRWMWKQVYRQGLQLVTVTRYFGEAVIRRMGRKPLFVIPNSVDSKLFYPVEKPDSGVFRFIHVSTLDENKNFRDIAQAVRLVADAGKKLELLVYGPYVEAHHRQTVLLNLSSIVSFRGEVSHEALAAQMRQCHALVLYSFQETFGNVLIEANSCGLPVIVSDLEVFKEIIEDGVNGLFAKGQNPQHLAEKMVWVMENYSTFKTTAIAEKTRERFHPEVIADLFDQLYRTAFQNRS